MAGLAFGSGARQKGTARCLACGERIVGPLAALGSLRCSDCRSTRRSLDEALVRGLTSSRSPRGRR
ncbi:MAG TPA: hypothetical protein VGQ15_11460 [Gaiellaceae bacterium]|nr:hypothetical protein [Gaiellaceae bacterium]